MTDKVNKRGVCSIEGCGRTKYTRGYCVTHHTRWLNGDPIDAPIRQWRRRSATKSKTKKKKKLVLPKEPEKTFEERQADWWYLYYGASKETIEKYHRGDLTANEFRHYTSRLDDSIADVTRPGIQAADMSRSRIFGERC